MAEFIFFNKSLSVAYASILLAVNLKQPSRMQDDGTKPPVTINGNVYAVIKQSIPILNKNGSLWRSANEMLGSREWALTRACGKLWVIFAVRCKRADESERSTRTQPLLSQFNGTLAFKRFYKRPRRRWGIYASLIREVRSLALTALWSHTASAEWQIIFTSFRFSWNVALDIFVTVRSSSYFNVIVFSHIMRSPVSMVMCWQAQAGVLGGRAVVGYEGCLRRYLL